MPIPACPVSLAFGGIISKHTGGIPAPGAVFLCRESAFWTLVKMWLLYLIMARPLSILSRRSLSASDTRRPQLALSCTQWQLDTVYTQRLSATAN